MELQQAVQLVVRKNKWRIEARTSVRILSLCALLVSVCTTRLHATSLVTSQSARTAGGHFGDGATAATVLEAGGDVEVDPWATSRHFASSLGLSLRKQSVRSNQESGTSSSVNEAGSITAGQNFGLMHNLSVSHDASRAESDDIPTRSTAWGTRLTSWVVPDRLRLGLGYRNNDIKAGVFDFTDIDGKRVITPDRIQGKTTTFDILGYLTSTTITGADWSWTTRNDRPPAWTSGLQIRQYFSRVNGALHIQAQHAENVGTIKPVTDYGRVVANSLTSEWHQKFEPQWVVMAGIRTYIEEEAPRALQSTRQITGSDYIYMSMRFRMIRSWTLRASEISALWGRYFNNRDKNGQMVAIGFNWNQN